MEKFCLESKMSWFQLVLVFFHLGTHILGLNFLAKNLYWKLLSWLVHSIGVKPPWKISVWEKVVLETVPCKIPKRSQKTAWRVVNITLIVEVSDSSSDGSVGVHSNLWKVE